MAKTFFEGTSKSHGDTVALTKFMGSAHLLESEKTRDCLQVSIGSDGVTLLPDLHIPKRGNFVNNSPNSYLILSLMGWNHRILSPKNNWA